MNLLFCKHFRNHHDRPARFQDSRIGLHPSPYILPSFPKQFARSSRLKQHAVTIQQQIDNRLAFELFHVQRHSAGQESLSKCGGRRLYLEMCLQTGTSKQGYEFVDTPPVDKAWCGLLD